MRVRIDFSKKKILSSIAEKAKFEMTTYFFKDKMYIEYFTIY